jgi:hypothetical protein
MNDSDLNLNDVVRMVAFHKATGVLRKYDAEFDEWLVAWDSVPGSGAGDMRPTWEATEDLEVCP